MVRTLITGLQKTSQQYIRFAFSEKATGLCSGISPATSVSSQAVFNGTSLHNIRDGIEFGVPANYAQPDGNGGGVTPPHNFLPASFDISHNSQENHTELEKGAIDRFLTT